MKVLTTLLVVGMFLTTVAIADDADDVRAAVQNHFAALNAGNVDAFIPYYPSETSVFAGGGLLERFHSLEERRNDFQAGVDAGEKLNLQLQHMEVKVYGNAAIVTGYVVGTITTRDGTTLQSRDQRTGVLIKQGGQWKEVHRHASPLQFPQEQSALEGVWKIEEVTAVGGPDEGTNTNPQSSLYIFAKQHYSIMRVSGSESRPLRQGSLSRSELTDAQKIAEYEPFVANAGIYELQGSSIITRPVVALSPNFMSGGSATVEYRVAGDSLWLMSRPTSGPVTERTWKLARVE